VPLRAESPVLAFRQFRDPLNGLLHRTVTQRPLVLIVSKSEGHEAALHFRDPKLPIPTAVPVGPWYLALSQVVRVDEAKSNDFVLWTVSYRYAIQHDSSATTEPIIRYEFVSTHVDPELSYCRNHVHLHPKFNGVVDGIAPSDLHLPTGWITIESVLRFLITEMQVPPLSENWQDVLRESEEQFETWTAREV